MFAEYDSPADVMVTQALQYLHGFDMTYRSADRRLIGHGPLGEYVRSLEQVAAELDAWLERCDAYDADPTKWLADRRREAEAAVQREREQR
jgi:hypothetical protein